jgi:hypothetical protein
MFKLGWGTPTLITADLGIVLQLPSPIIIVLLGTLSAKIPRPEGAVVEINLDILGVLDLTEKKLSIDASLRDSRIAAFTLTGDLALRYSWGAEPDFALSLGGFNPAFRPPPSFPTLRRLSLALGSGQPAALPGGVLRAHLQLAPVRGAGRALRQALGFTVLGYLEFHALFIFRPFSFRFDFAAGLSLRRGNSVLAAITVTGQLKGPRPWYIKATASITVLFFDVSVSFERPSARPPEPELAPGGRLGRLLPALADLRNWSATLPDRAPPVGCRRRPTGEPPRVRLDPMSQLAVRQKVLPLDRRITKLGRGRHRGPARFRIRRRPRAGTGAGAREAPSSPRALNEPFAAAQYQTLTDARAALVGPPSSRWPRGGGPRRSGPCGREPSCAGPVAHAPAGAPRGGGRRRRATSPRGWLGRWGGGRLEGRRAARHGDGALRAFQREPCPRRRWSPSVGPWPPPATSTPAPAQSTSAAWGTSDGGAA